MYLIILGLLAALNNPAYAATISDLTKKAIANGSSAGVVEGDIVHKISEQTHSLEPVTLSVETIKKYKQQGCARLNYTLKQDKALLKNGGTTPLTSSWQMNICEDGKPPLEAE
jgi:hypothetical protein